jgi:uncharacterized protein (DUF697 family)
MGLFGKSNDNAENSGIQEKLSDGIMGAVDSVMKNREEYYNNNPAPSKDEIKGIISSCSNKNAVISGGAGLIPGPFGMAAAIPEIIAIINNQLKMIYDVGKANGQDKALSKELLISVLFGSMGSGAIGLLVVNGQKVMAKRVGARALQSVIKALGGKISQQLAKSMAAKWIPLAGAVAMASWSKYSTLKIGEKAIEIFSKEISVENENSENEEIIIDIPNEDINIAKQKIEILINLMKIDGNIEDDEIEFIENFIDNSNLTSDDRMSLIEQISKTEKTKVNYSIFKDNTEEGLYLLIDLIALSKADGEFHITEKMFIKEIAKSLEFDKEDLKELME